LPLAIVKMGTMDRDDKGDKRIPVLMNYLSAFRLYSSCRTRGWLTYRRPAAQSSR
jgi:hypothetical protein